MATSFPRESESHPIVVKCWVAAVGIEENRVVIDELLQIECVVLSSSRDDAKQLVLCVELGWVNTEFCGFQVCLRRRILE